MQTENQIKPTCIDFKEERIKMQQENIKNVEELLLNSEVNYFNNNEFDEKKFNDDKIKYLNGKELNRYLRSQDITIQAFLEQMQTIDNHNIKKQYINLAACLFSKKAIRQGNILEKKQIAVMNETAEKISKNITQNLEIEQLGTTEKRMVKDSGEILDNNKFKERKKEDKNYKEKCFKSFDAEFKIDNRIEAYMSLKICYGDGGHQDNVVHELTDIAERWSRYHSDTKLFIIIDTDKDNAQKVNAEKDKIKKFEHVKVFDHITFQQYIIDTYS